MIEHLLNKTQLKNTEKQTLINESKWLKEDTPISLRKFCIRHKFKSYNDFPNCPVCNIQLPWSVHHNCFKSFCSKPCEKSNKGKEVILQRFKETNLKKYGVENPFQSKEKQEKIKQTNLKKYGVENPQQNKDIREKAQQTSLDRYGAKCSLQNEEVKEKIKQTNLEKYGVENPRQNRTVKEKAKQTNLKKYGVSNPMQNKEINTKQKQTVKEKYGVDNISQSDEIKEKIEINRRKKYWNIFVAKIKLKQMTYWGDKDSYLNNSVFKFKCNRCGNFFTTKTLNPQKIHCLDFSHKHRSVQEEEISEWIKSLGINNIIKNKIFSYQNEQNEYFKREIDIYLPDLNIGIEHHGLYWHCDLERDRKYHSDKRLIFESKGIRLIQIFSSEWINKRSIVESIIKNLINKCDNRIYARYCIIKEIDTEACRLFCEENHLQGYVHGTIKLGIFHNDELIGIQIYSNRRFIQDIETDNFELIRACNKINTSIIGGFSKILKYFIKNYNPLKIDSFVDLRYFNGSGYFKNGFKQIKITEPNYFYFKSGREHLYTRNYFQKHLLKNKLKIFDENKTEYENMINNGYLRIFDAGNLLLSLNITQTD